MAKANGSAGILILYGISHKGAMDVFDRFSRTYRIRSEYIYPEG